MTKRPARASVLAGAVVLATVPCASAPTPRDFSAMRRTVMVATPVASRDPKPAAGLERGRTEAEVADELGRARDRLTKAEARVRSTSGELAAETRARADAEAKVRVAREDLSAASPVSVKEDPRGTVVAVPSRSLFAFGEPRLLPAGEARLAPIAEALAQGDRPILVEDHSSEESSPELSRTRAEAVRDFFVARGIRWDRLTARASDERPRGAEASVSRIEIVVEPSRAR
jgi:outer membrane protein OmpA-like peptidoglycan-associated protein